MHSDVESLRQLPLAEKLRVVEMLWEDIAVSTEEFPMPTWMRDEVKNRLVEYGSDPSAALNRKELWKQVDERT